MKKGWKMRLWILSLIVKIVFAVALILRIHSYCESFYKEVKEYKEIKEK